MTIPYFVLRLWLSRCVSCQLSTPNFSWCFASIFEGDWRLTGHKLIQSVRLSRSPSEVPNLNLFVLRQTDNTGSRISRSSFIPSLVKAAEVDTSRCSEFMKEAVFRTFFFATATSIFIPSFFCHIWSWIYSFIILQSGFDVFWTGTVPVDTRFDSTYSGVWMLASVQTQKVSTGKRIWAKNVCISWSTSRGETNSFSITLKHARCQFVSPSILYV